MSGYISEISYDKNASEDFIEIAVPAGTDVSGYTVQVYDQDGVLTDTYSLGVMQSKIDGKNVYLVDDSDPAWAGLTKTQAVALVDEQGNVAQFISFDGTTVTATEGDAAGQTSRDVGSAKSDHSLQTDDGGATYYKEHHPNPSTIPCFARGTLIETDQGPRPVETLQPGDRLITLDDGIQDILWTRQRRQSLATAPDDERPVMIRAEALGPGCPSKDLILSPQHRILVGEAGQLQAVFNAPAFVPAKALLVHPHIRAMLGRTSITWVHFALRRHQVIVANGCATESLLLGPMVINRMTALQRFELTQIFGTPAVGQALNGPPARTCLKTGEAQKLLTQASMAKRRAA